MDKQLFLKCSMSSMYTSFLCLYNVFGVIIHAHNIPLQRVMNFYITWHHACQHEAVIAGEELIFYPH